MTELFGYVVLLPFFIVGFACTVFFQMMSMFIAFAALIFEFILNIVDSIFGIFGGYNLEE